MIPTKPIYNRLRKQLKTSFQFVSAVTLGSLMISSVNAEKFELDPKTSAAFVNETRALNQDSIEMCFGYRGNGSSVFATLGGMARLFDQFDAPKAVVGTSSGSVAAFLTESIMVPNDVYECSSCSKETVNERRSFMLKGFPLSINAISNSDGLREDFSTIENGKEIFDVVMGLFKGVGLGGLSGGQSESDGGGNPILNSDAVKAVLNSAAMIAVQNQSIELKNFIAPSYYQISGVSGSVKPELVTKAIDNLLAFQGIASGNTFTRQALMYPGVVNFDYIFQLMGVVGDWYAGYGSVYPRAEVTNLLDQCTPDTRGVWWNDIAKKPYKSGTCGSVYFDLFNQYFNARKKNPSGKQRINEEMGIYLPAFVSTSAISGNGAVKSMNTWADAGEFDSIDGLKLGRENFKVLYFGSEAYKNVVQENKSMFQDVLTQNIVSMGSVSWLMGMKASGQEPATSRSMTFSLDGNDYLSTGGYVDQLQTKFMKMIGCDKTVVINTNEPILGFANRYSGGIWDQDKTLVADLLNPNDPESSESIAFEQTSALLCSRWGSYGITEIWEMADNSYHNFVFTQDADLLKEPERFAKIDGEISTVNAEPKTCYEMPSEKKEQFPPYKIN